MLWKRKGSESRKERLRRLDVQWASLIDRANSQGKYFSQHSHLLETRQDNLIILLPLSQVVYLEQLLACVDVLLRQCESDHRSVSLQLLQVLVTVQSLSTEPHLSEKVRKQLVDAILSAALFSFCST